jgi:hypothetical protein
LKDIPRDLASLQHAITEISTATNLENTETQNGKIGDDLMLKKFTNEGGRADLWDALLVILDLSY